MLDTDTGINGAYRQYSAFISSVFLSVSWRLTDTDETYQYQQKSWGRCILQFKQDQRNTVKKNILKKIAELLRKDCVSWYRITDICMMLPRLAQGQTAPTEQLGRKSGALYQPSWAPLLSPQENNGTASTKGQRGLTFDYVWAACQPIGRPAGRVSCKLPPSWNGLDVLGKHWRIWQIGEISRLSWHTFT